MGKSHLFGLLIVPFVNVYQIHVLCVSYFLFGIEGGIWGVIVLILEHCLSIYFVQMMTLISFLYREI